MGRIRNGGNGAFSGKAGSFIGSSWRDISYIKGLPKLSNKPKSEKQLEQQAKFALAVRFLLPVKRQLNIGFGKVKQGKATSFNAAVQQILNYAITGIYPDYEIDYPYAAFSYGSLSEPAAVTVLAGVASLEISWDNNVIVTNGYADDLLTVLVYDPQSNTFAMGPPNTMRSSQAVTVALPAHWTGRTVHIYMYYMSQQTGELSKTFYAGSEIVG
ncbi:MAG: DUF6266 family protein [Daejeonella sp.]|uniref:DUF6266 family protein n=1 Tax=Daejeonella sp. TaxID=2805397 RepID=UPI003C773BB7